MSNKPISYYFRILFILLCIPFSFYGDEFDPSGCIAPGMCMPDDDFKSLSDEEQRQKYSENADYLRGWADAGVAEAQTNLGFIYAEGLGVEQDNVQAVYWYRKAAEQDDAMAQMNLALMYENGLGVEQDYTQAVHWYRRSAEQDFSDAQNNLAIMYFRGRGIEKDLKEALVWFSLASLNGNEQAKTNFEQFDIKNKLSKQDRILIGREVLRRQEEIQQRKAAK